MHSHPETRNCSQLNANINELVRTLILFPFYCLFILWERHRRIPCGHADDDKRFYLYNVCWTRKSIAHSQIYTVAVWQGNDCISINHRITIRLGAATVHLPFSLSLSPHYPSIRPSNDPTILPFLYLSNRWEPGGNGSVRIFNLCALGCI